MKNKILLMTMVFAGVIFAGGQKELCLNLAMTYDIFIPRLMKNYDESTDFLDKQKTIHALLNLQSLDREFYEFISTDPIIKKKYLEYGFNCNSKLNNIIRIVCDKKNYWQERDLVEEKDFAEGLVDVSVKFSPALIGTLVYSMSASLKALENDSSYKLVLLSLGQLPFMYGMWHLNTFLLKEQNVVKNIKDYRNNNQKIEEAQKQLSTHLSTSFFTVMIYDLLNLNLFHKESKIYEDFINSEENNLNINLPTGDCLELSRIASNIEHISLVHGMQVNLLKLENNNSMRDCFHGYKYVLDIFIPNIYRNDINFNTSKINFKNLAEDLIEVLTKDYKDQKIMIKLHSSGKGGNICAEQNLLLFYFLGILLESECGQNIIITNKIDKCSKCYVVRIRFIQECTEEFVPTLKAFKKLYPEKYHEERKDAKLYAKVFLKNENPYQKLILNELKKNS